MSSTKCAKCNNSSFKIEEITPRGSNFKLMSICCTSCGAPAGFMDYYNIGNLVHEQAKEIKDLRKTVNNIEHMVVQIGNIVSRR